jgi:hypothetical protein
MPHTIPLTKVSLLLAITLLAAGCDRAWDAYNEIQLGKPVPAESLLAEKGVNVEGGWAWDRQIIRRLPAMYGIRRISVKTDENGIAIAKHHLTNTAVHGVLFISVSCQTQQESLIPDAIQADIAAGKMTQKKFLTWWKNVLSKPPEDPRDLIDGHTWEPSTVDMILFAPVAMALSATSEPVGHRNTIINYAPDLLEGLAKKGFDRTFWPRHEVGISSLRIWNPDGKRIRMESYTGLLSDPCFAMPMLLASTCYSSEKEIYYTTGNASTPSP